VRRNIRLAVTGCAVAVVLGGAALAAMPADAQTVSTLDPAQVRGSVAYLRQTYGVSEREALRRLALQQTAQDLAGRLAQRAPSTYAGVWIDQAAGGRLVVASTAPASLANELRGVPDRAHIAVQRVTHSLAELQASQQRLAAALGDGPASVLLPKVVVRENRVVVFRRDWLLTKGLRVAAVPGVSTVDSAVAAEGDRAEVRALREPEPLFTPNVDVGYCHPLYCGAKYGPIRGGIRLDISRDDGTVGGCTSGFTVRAHGGTFDGTPFVLTAGHCVGSARHTHIDAPEHNGAELLTENPALVSNAFPFDYAVLPYTNTTVAKARFEKFNKHNLVLSFCRTGPNDSQPGTTCVDGNLAIKRVTRFEDVVAGSIVCASGAAASSVDYPASYDSGPGVGYRPGTRCGQVTSKDVAINTDICARAGDSGGPLFSEVDHAGYGILEGSLQHRVGVCLPGEDNNYVPLSTIFDQVNSQPSAGGSTFGVITTARG
jgi:streptogrisin C